MRRTPTERLAARSREAVCFTRGLALPCWVYTGFLTAKGYSVVKVDNRRNSPSHRAAYEELIGPIPEGLEPDHLCRNRACWNPWHLDVVTHSINMMRSHAGVVIRSRAALVTHCPQGHAYTGKNDRRRKNGKRYCLECANVYQRRKSADLGRGAANADKTHCPQGHPYDAENTYVNPSGQRTCRTCRRAAFLRFKERQQTA